ncbi:MAG TPA: sigma-70 family RNA polymerase sigma factor [Terracidiphilus sp.]|jgi:RNA polymerase sigma-70 factor (ECF subfamily)|nr:sigma-70 family RNA polymerase sigma factor [Terracidiphilus sp.]
MTLHFDGAIARSRAAAAGATALCDPVAGNPRVQTRPRPRARKSAVRAVQEERMVYLRSPRLTEKALQFREFDASYIENLRTGDPRTQEHFAAYFTELLHLKLRSRLQSPHAIEDVRQETFARVLTSLRKEGALRRPECLGAFVNTVCNNVLFEHYRMSSRSQSLDEEGQPELPAANTDMLGMVAAKELKANVRQILLDLPERDRLLLNAVFLEERDRDEVCRERGVDREYLRVLLHRAKQTFKTAYVKRVGEGFYSENA